MTQVLITNLHSAQNLGDLVIVEQTMRLISQKYESADFVLMATYPSTWNDATSIKCIPSLFQLVIGQKGKINSVKALIKILNISFLKKELGQKKQSSTDSVDVAIQQISKANIVISAGGGNFYSNSNFGLSFVMNCLTIIIAGKLGKRIFMMPQSFGPLRCRWQQRLMKKTASYVEVIFARELISFEYLQKIGVSPEKLKILPDLAFTSKPTLPRLSCISNSDKLIALTVINRNAQDKKFTNQTDYETAIIEYIKYILRSDNSRIRILVQCAGPTPDQDDRLITRKIASYFQDQADRIQVVEQFKTAKEFLESITEADMIVSTRLHSGIFGLVNNIPTVLIGYQPKAKGLFTMLGLEDFYISIDDVKSDYLVDRTKKIFSDYQGVQEVIRQQVSKISERIQNEMLSMK